MRFLLPTAGEVRDLAARETDPLQYERFRPIAKGPLVAVSLLAFAGIAATVAFPFVLLRRAIRRG